MIVSQNDKSIKPGGDYRGYAVEHFSSFIQRSWRRDSLRKQNSIRGQHFLTGQWQSFLDDLTFKQSANYRELLGDRSGLTSS
jgi:hypothetical protein